jgi:hypothetical protein
MGIQEQTSWAGPSQGRCGRVCRPLLPYRTPSMFRLRNLVLLWLGRKAWALARPAIRRRLRKRPRTNP